MLIYLSFYRDELPWLYDAGHDLLSILKIESDPENKARAIYEFRDLMEFSFRNLRTHLRTHTISSKDFQFTRNSIRETLSDLLIQIKPEKFIANPFEFTNQIEKAQLDAIKNFKIDTDDDNT